MSAEFRGCDKGPVLVNNWEEWYCVLWQSGIEVGGQFCKDGTLASVGASMVGSRATQDAVGISGGGTSDGSMFAGTRGTMYLTDTLLFDMPVFLAIIAPNWLLYILADYYPCVCDK